MFNFQAISPATLTPTEFTRAKVRASSSIALIAMLTMAASALLASPDACAALGTGAGGAFAWTDSLCKFVKIITGPIAGGVAAIIIAWLGISFAAGEEKSVMSTGVRIVFGIGICVASASLITFFFPQMAAFACK